MNWFYMLYVWRLIVVITELLPAWTFNHHSSQVLLALEKEVRNLRGKEGGDEELERRYRSKNKLSYELS